MNRNNLINQNTIRNRFKMSAKIPLIFRCNINGGSCTHLNVKRITNYLTTDGLSKLLLFMEFVNKGLKMSLNTLLEDWLLITNIILKHQHLFRSKEHFDKIKKLHVIHIINTFILFYFYLER